MSVMLLQQKKREEHGVEGRIYTRERTLKMRILAKSTILMLHCKSHFQWVRLC